MSWLLLLPTMVVVVILGGVGGAFLIAAGADQFEAAWLVLFSTVIGFFWNIGLLEGDPKSKIPTPRKDDTYELPQKIYFSTKVRTFPTNAGKWLKSAAIAPIAFLPWFVRRTWWGVIALIELLLYIVGAIIALVLFLVVTGCLGIAVYWVVMQWLS